MVSLPPRPSSSCHDNAPHVCAVPPLSLIYHGVSTSSYLSSSQARVTWPIPLLCVKRNHDFDYKSYFYLQPEGFSFSQNSWCLQKSVLFSNKTHDKLRLFTQMDLFQLFLGLFIKFVSLHLIITDKLSNLTQGSILAKILNVLFTEIVYKH